MNHMNRRVFIGGSAMAGVSLAFPGMLRAGQDDRPQDAWQPKLALSSVMFSGLSLEAFCAKAAELEFKGIDLWGPFDKCRHMYEAVEMGADAFRKLLERHRLQVGAWTTYHHKKHDKAFPDFAEFIGACGGGIVVRGTEYGNVRQELLEDAIKAFYDKLGPEIELARKHRVRLALENHSWSLFDRQASFEWFHQHNPAPDVVGFAIAPYHLQRGGMDVAAVIRQYAGQTLFFYAWQMAEGTGQLPGAGPTDFKPWMQALRDAKYQHWMTPFMHGDLPPGEMAAAVAKSTTYLNNLIQES
jgi:sugar phosphate isomerase/epimerase